MRRCELATGVELAVHERGSGEPVLLLLHAWGETNRIFDRLVPLLAGSARIVVPDQRGVGESSKPATGYSLEESAADVVGLMDALDITRCWLVGTSSGGYVAQEVALEHPERVLGMVLIGTPRDLRRPLPAGFSDFLASLRDPISSDVVDQLAIPLHEAVSEEFLATQTEAALTIPAHVWRDVLEGLQEAVPPTDRGAIRTPTLVLWGGADDLLPTDEGAALHAAIPGSHLVTYEGTGHLVLVEQPGRVAQDIIDFITSPA
jgi:pimeloyl-ACP methyl ester carboxylesterase